MAIPNFQVLMLPVLKHASEGETRTSALAPIIAKELNLPQAEADQMIASGRQTILQNRTYWAKLYLAQAGLLRSTRPGWFTITDEGRALLSRNPERIDLKSLTEYPAFRDFMARRNRPNKTAVEANESITASTVATPEEQIDAAHLSIQSALRADLLQRILQCSPGFFEQLIIDLLVKMGYGGTREDAAQQLGGSGDGGVDGVISEDRLGLDQVYIQAKRYSPRNSVGRPDVQSFVGSLVGRGATKGVFVTTSTFSSQASEFARHLPQRIILIDGQQLADLMIEHEVGVRVSQTIKLKKLDEDFFSEEN